MKQFIGYRGGQMVRIGSIKVTVGEGEDHVRAWLAAAEKERLACALTSLSTTREGDTLHRDVVSCKGSLYKIVVKGGLAQAEAVPPGSVLPESVQVKASGKHGEGEAALQEWLEAAAASSCDVLPTGPAFVALNGIATVVHRYTGRRYEVLFTGTIGDGSDLIAVPK